MASGASRLSFGRFGNIQDSGHGIGAQVRLSEVQSTRIPSLANSVDFIDEFGAVDLEIAAGLSSLRVVIIWDVKRIPQ